MCDYSLLGIPNRLAREGDDLILHRFGTGTIGLAAAHDIEIASNGPKPTTLWARLKYALLEIPEKLEVCAVCIPPGAELVVKRISHAAADSWKLYENDRVTFTQISASPHQHRDALRLPDGRQVLLQRLREGIRVQVTCLGGDAEPAGFEQASFALRDTDDTRASLSVDSR